MIDKWFSTIELALSIEDWRRLPRNAAYKYELIDGRVYLSPRPKYCHAALDLDSFEAPENPWSDEPVAIRPLVEDDWIGLISPFLGAFHRVQPFESLDDETQRQAATAVLQQTRDGGDGPLIHPASFVATLDDDKMIGAILVTLLPLSDREDHVSIWRDPPPPDAIEQRAGRPHLTWVFVGPFQAGQGIGTSLLAASVSALLGLGFTQLITTFMLGNDSSLLWHWRNGFRLLQSPISRRRLQLGF